MRCCITGWVMRKNEGLTDLVDKLVTGAINGYGMKNGALHNMNGRICGIGVGIGDPEDITLKAVKMIKESDVLVCPKEDLGECRAYQIVKQVIPEVEDMDIMPVEFEMTKDENKRIHNHRRIYETVKKLVLEGKIVSFITIGDPALYSTYSYVSDLARKDGIETHSISGITSLTACANRLGISLCEGREQLHVIPTIDDIDDALDLPGTKVIMKCGKRIKTVKEKLRSKVGIDVYAISGCGTSNERCFRSLEEIPEDEIYMMTMILKSR